MAIVNVSELTGAALNWAVAKCLYHGKASPFRIEVIRGGVYRVPVTSHASGGWFRLSWEVCGPIIEREKIKIDPVYGDVWVATLDHRPAYTEHANDEGPNPLIAAMRCYVASKLGETVEIPNELV